MPAALATDADGDGAVDLLLAGNRDGLKPDLGRLASSAGVFLRGDGRGGEQQCDRGKRRGEYGSHNGPLSMANRRLRVTRRLVTINKITRISKW